MRRRLIPVLATGLLLLAGFAAAAVASGGSALDLIASPATTTHSAGSSRSAKLKRAITPASPLASTEEPDADTDEGKPDAAEPKSTTQSEHKVAICHHTGSWRHPFHRISVAEHSVSAHTRHGDTLGNCPSVPASEPRTTSHGKPPWAHGRKRGARLQSSGHPGRGNSGHEEADGRDPSSAHESNRKLR
jgi:hypothetical protein